MSALDTVHNPDRFMADLRQILSQGRKRIGVLIGAGGPLSVRVDAHGKLDPTGQPLIPGVNVLTDQALVNLTGTEATAAAAIRNSLPDGGNIETILSKVRLLQTALGDMPMHGLDGAGYAGLGKSICAAIGEIVGAKLPEGRTPYHELVSWVSGTQRAHPIEIFTTNYDLLIESAFEGHHGDEKLIVWHGLHGPVPILIHIRPCGSGKATPAARREAPC